MNRITSLCLALVCGMAAFGTDAAFAQSSAKKCEPAPNITQRWPQPVIVSFDSGSTKIKAEDAGKLDKLAKDAKDNYVTQICVTGFADKTGDAQRNARLSQARANAVAEALRKRGIAADALIVSGKGETFSNSMGFLASSSRAERRVEVRVAR